MMKIKLSLIVPVYNVEKYIKRFLKSLDKNLEQNVEVIFINDGSTDNCGKILDEYQLKNSEFVKVIHQNNKGVGAARNIGLNNALGKYIVFVDPDDALSDDFINSIFAGLVKFKYPDVLLFGQIRVEGKINKKVKDYGNEGMIDKLTLLRDFANEQNVGNGLCNKVLKASKCKEIMFSTEMALGEDAFYLTKLLLTIESAAYINKYIYFYYSNDGSLSKVVSSDNYINWFNAALFRYNEYSKIVDGVSIIPVIGVAHGICKRKYHGIYDIDVRKFEQFILKNKKTIFLDKNIPFRWKKQCLFYYLGIARFYEKYLGKKI